MTRSVNGPLWFATPRKEQEFRLLPERNVDVLLFVAKIFTARNEVAWQGGVCGRGCACGGVCMAGLACVAGGACVAGEGACMAGEMATAAESYWNAFLSLLVVLPL